MQWVFGALLLFVVTPVLSRAEDQLIQKSGAVITGQIVGVANGQVTVLSRTPSGGSARLAYTLSDIKSVVMTTPDAVAAAKGQPPAAVVASLEPVVKQYAGLPVDWLLDAMGQLADAESALGQDAAAAEVYRQINQLYPGSPYANIAVAGEAKQLLKQGKVDQALAAVQPVVDAANKNVAPPPTDARAYADAFLVYGQALEAQKKLPEALEAYLTVKTMFYQNSAVVEQSDKLVQNLRAQNPDLGVN